MAYQPKSYRKFLAGTVTTALVASVVAPVAGAQEAQNEITFSDVAITDTHGENIYKAVELGLVRGYTDGTFRPYQELKRSDVIKILGRYVIEQEGFAGLAEYLEANDNLSDVEPFADLPETTADKETYSYSLVVKNAGIFTGNTTTNMVRPFETITRQEMATVLVRAFDLQDLEGVESGVTDLNSAFETHRENIQILSENGVTTETTFRPQEVTYRGQFASFVIRALNLAPIFELPAFDLAFNEEGNQFTATFEEAISEDVTDASLIASVVAAGVKVNGETASAELLEALNLMPEWNEDRTAVTFTHTDLDVAVRVLGLDVEEIELMIGADASATYTLEMFDIASAEVVDGKVSVTFEGDVSEEEAAYLVSTLEFDPALTVVEGTVEAATAAADDHTSTFTFEVEEDLSEVTSLSIVGFDGEELPNPIVVVSEELVIQSFSPVNSKTLEVKFSKPVNADEVNFSVKRDSITASVSEVRVSEDGLSAELELASKFIAGTYVVTVTGATEEALTASVNVEAEKVESINILSDRAAYTGVSVDDEISVAYRVLNQYGEDITRTTNITATASKGTVTLDTTNGKATITTGTSFTNNEQVVLSLINPESAVSAVRTLTVSPAARVAEVDASNTLYNADGKVINETNILTDAFYILVDATDQYGNAVTSTTALDNDLLITESNTSVADVAASFETIQVDGVNRTALRVNQPAGTPVAGTSIVTLISTTTGNTDQVTINVAAANRTDNITLSSAGIVVVDEDAYIPAVVTDTEGQEIKDLSILNNATRGAKVTFDGSSLASAFVLVGGETFVKIPASSLMTSGNKSLLVVTATNKTATQVVNVRAAAEPRVITGLKSDVQRAALNGQTITLGLADLRVEDQYGREMSAAKLGDFLDASGDNKLRVATSNSPANAFNIATGTGTTVTANEVVELDASGDEFTLTSTGTVGTEQLTFTLYNTDGAITGSQAQANFRTVAETSFTSYVVNDVPTVYDEVGATKVDDDSYDEEIEVFGVLSDGVKVPLTVNTHFTVRSDANATVNTDVTDGTIDADTALSYGDANSVSVPVIVTVNRTGQEITKNVTFSKVAPQVSSVKLVNGTATSAAALTTIDFDDLETALTADELALNDLTDTQSIVVTDQYGRSVLANANGTVDFADTTTSSAPTLTFVPVNGEFTITNNGTSGATLSGVGANESFDLRVTYSTGVSTTVRVTNN